MQLVGLQHLLELEGMRDHAGGVDGAAVDVVQRLTGAGVTGIVDGADARFQRQRFPEAFEDGEVHRLEAGHAEDQYKAILRRDFDCEADGRCFAGGFDHDIGQVAVIESAQGVPC